MRTMLKLLVACALALVALTLMRYRHVDPCKALEREIVRQVERQAQATADSVQKTLAALGGERAAQAAEGVASAVQNVSVGVAQGVAKTRVEHMSRSECVAELWRMARND